MGRAIGIISGVPVSLRPNHRLGLVFSLRLRLAGRLVRRVLAALWCVTGVWGCGWALFHQQPFISAPTEMCDVHFPGFPHMDSKEWVTVQSVSWSVFDHLVRARHDERSEALLTRREGRL